MEKNENGQFHIFANCGRLTRPLDWTYAEVLAVYLMCHTAQQSFHAIPYLSALISAMMKLKSAVPNFFEDGIEQQLRRMSVCIGPTARTDAADFFQDILLAQERRYSLRIEYDSIYEKHSIVTVLLPYHCHFTNHAWYVTGRSSFHQQIRTFHISRILSLEPLTDAPFIVPFGWTFEKYMGNAWSMLRGEEDVEVELRFKPLVARNVTAVRWHKTEHFHKNADGSLSYFVTVSGVREILWWILGYGDQVEVIRPDFLRKIVVEKIQNMAKIYEPDG